jgi:hypothetical protein
VICPIPLRGIDDLDLRESERASSACFEDRREGLRDIRPERNEDGLIGEGASGQGNSRQECVKGEEYRRKMYRIVGGETTVAFPSPHPYIEKRLPSLRCGVFSV